MTLEAALAFGLDVARFLVRVYYEMPESAEEDSTFLRVDCEVTFSQKFTRHRKTLPLDIPPFEDRRYRLKLN